MCTTAPTDTITGVTSRRCCVCLAARAASKRSNLGPADFAMAFVLGLVQGQTGEAALCDEHFLDYRAARSRLAEIDHLVEALGVHRAGAPCLG